MLKNLIPLLHCVPYIFMLFFSSGTQDLKRGHLNFQTYFSRNLAYPQHDFIESFDAHASVLSIPATLALISLQNYPNPNFFPWIAEKVSQSFQTRRDQQEYVLFVVIFEISCQTPNPKIFKSNFLELGKGYPYFATQIIKILFFDPRLKFANIVSLAV